MTSLDSFNALAIGDDNQDIEMFQVVDYKLAIGNAKKTDGQESIY